MVETREDVGFRYYSRHFRSRDGRLPAGWGATAAPHDSLTVLTLPADNGTWSVVFTTSSEDRELRALKDTAVWDRVSRLLPPPAPLDRRRAARGREGDGRTRGPPSCLRRRRTATRDRHGAGRRRLDLHQPVARARRVHRPRPRPRPADVAAGRRAVGARRARAALRRGDGEHRRTDHRGHDGDRPPPHQRAAERPGCDALRQRRSTLAAVTCPVRRGGEGRRRPACRHLHRPPPGLGAGGAGRPGVRRARSSSSVATPCTARRPGRPGPTSSPRSGTPRPPDASAAGHRGAVRAGGWRRPHRRARRAPPGRTRPAHR